MEDPMPDYIIILISTIVGAFLGGGITWFVSRDTVKFSRIAEIANTIRDIFIDDLERIRKLESNKNDESNRITVENINRTDFLIRKYFCYISKSKRRKIERHYLEYKEPYKATPTEINPFNAFPSKEEIYYPDTYIRKQIPDAITRTKHYIEKLINDF